MAERVTGGRQSRENGYTVKKRDAGIITISMVTAGFVLSGCISSPTYGTDKTTGQQLIDDFSNIASIKSNTNKNQVDTRPRPELVRPAPGTKGVLPQPQASVAKAGSPDWPESPEQRRQRLRDEATANQNNPNYVSPIVSDGSQSGKTTGSSEWQDGIHRNDGAKGNDKEQRAEYLRRKKENEGGSATTRKYLSEPPLTYRQPAASAPIGDEGEDEAKKERQRKKALKGASGKKSWWPF